MLQFPSQDIITQIKQKYQVADYQFRALEKFFNVSNLEGKKVLEIGGSNLPRKLVLDHFKCQKWVSVDVIDPSHYALTQQSNHYKLEKIYDLAEAQSVLDSDKYLIFNGFADNIPPLFYNSFDAVFSIACFEHVGKLSTVMLKIFNSLKDGGVLYSRFSPIWSCSVGHHCWVSSEINFNNLGKIPEFGHLLMRPFEMFSYLSDFYSFDICENIVHQMYFSNNINRLFYEDYESMMALSKFKKYNFYPTSINAVDDQILTQLKTLHPARTRFDVYGIEIIAYKN